MSGDSFWDTNLLIYWLDKPEEWAEPIYRLRQWHKENEIRIITSALSLAEILVRPISGENLERAREYLHLISEMGCLGFGPDEAWAFAEIRSAYPQIKPPDCIQLACAGVRGVDYFCTNDEALQRVSAKGVGKIIILKNWFEQNL